MNILNKIKMWSLKKKLTFFLSWIILTTSMILLIVSTFSAVYYMTKQTKEMATVQLETLASNYDATLKQYQNLATALVVNDSIQMYCKSQNDESTIYGKQVNEVYKTLLSMMNVQLNMNFAVVKKENGGQVYKGKSSIVDAQFDTAYEIDYHQSMPTKEESTVSISFGNHYFRSGEYTLTLYQPIFSTTKIGEKNGMLILNLNDNFIKQIQNQQTRGVDSEMFLMDKTGRIVSISDNKKVGKNVIYKKEIKGTKGSFQKKGYLINFQQIGNLNYYLVNEIPVNELYKGSVKVMMVLAAIVLAMTAFTIIILRRMITKFYKPVFDVVTVMDHVADGKMDMRIAQESMDGDSKKLAQGFNTMMDKIVQLMEQVKTEQLLMEQIRFNMLQSQIKPHFLYNTLECIHWQAVADNNQEISIMVKALSHYYRICLSRGKDIITLGEEIDLVRSYITIQNMRYDNIVTLNIDILKPYFNVQIPKMTLQPLIENAIYHGIRMKEGKSGEIHIGIREETDDISIIVEDSGIGMEQRKIDEINRSISEHDGFIGYGVRNVNKRIEIMFGMKYGLLFSPNDKGGVTVEIHLPKFFQMENKEEP